MEDLELQNVLKPFNRPAFEGPEACNLGTWAPDFGVTHSGSSRVVSGVPCFLSLAAQ